jgi:type IV secretory pathway VirB2 component (pilin)
VSKGADCALTGGAHQPTLYAAAVPRTLRDLAILLGAFAASSAIAAALGAVNFGTALAFGQIGFALALVWVLLRS